MTARLILCTLMYFNSETSLEVVKLADESKGTNVVAFDIAGNSINSGFEEHVDDLRAANRMALESAFVDEETKAKLREELRDIS